MPVTEQGKNEQLYQFSFPLDLSVSEDKEKKEETNKSTVQICKEGKFVRETFFGTRTIEFNQNVFNKMINNFDNNIWGSELSVGLPFDAEHLDYLGALGWIKNLFTKETANGIGLFADVEWTPKGAQYIREGRFKYTSISYFRQYVKPEDPDTTYDYVVCGAALTTSPFLTGMEPVSLSRFKELCNIHEKEGKPLENLNEIVNNSLESTPVYDPSIPCETPELEEIKKTEVKEEQSVEIIEEKIEEVKESLSIEETKVPEVESLKAEIDFLKTQLSSKENNAVYNPEIDSLKTQVKELKLHNLSAKTQYTVGSWFGNAMKFKQDMREDVSEMLFTLHKIDEGLITPAEIGYKLSEKFSKIVESIPEIIVDLSEKGHNQNISSDPQDKMDNVVREYMELNKISNYAQAVRDMIKLGKMK